MKRQVRKLNICLVIFPVQNGLKQGDALMPLFFNFALEYVIRKDQENQMGLKLNETYQLLAYADNVNLLIHNTDTIKKKPNKLYKKVGLENRVYVAVSRPECKEKS
jgi:hypothetical protein